ncbi:hypothetical protein HHI36_005590 [Cryptolaemus montrouzieri]|uniref:Uncharacterized protein n=1 Tax=Cryptolaemus montrouzieri TaxID=559131 RepID=A0ABD2NUT8_9CUCU
MDLTNRKGNRYRQNLEQILNEICPNRKSYAQLMSNRVRWITTNAKLSKAELDAIKKSCSPTTVPPSNLPICQEGEVKKVDEALTERMEYTQSSAETVDLVYAGAVTACEMSGVSMEEKGARESTVRENPP